MAETKIEWADFTFNPWMGCTKVSPACAHCYAERDFDHRYGKVKWGPNGTRVLTSDANWKQPIKWERDASRAMDLWHRGESLPKEMPHRPRVFCASLADVFEDWGGPIINSDKKEVCICHGCGAWVTTLGDCGNGKMLCDRVPRKATMQDLRDRLFKLIDDTPDLDWLLLTKRPENIRRMWKSVEVNSQQQADDRNEKGELYRRNVWLGCSVENQEQADKRIPELLRCRNLSPVLFLSCEPLLGPVALNVSIPMKASQGDSDYGGFTLWNSLTGFRTHKCGGWTDSPPMKIDWVIAGGESGPKARPSHVDWFRSIRDQCETADVPFLFKQWGEHDADGNRVGKAIAGRMLDGRFHDEFPGVKSC